jgi:hypothetical protein
MCKCWKYFILKSTHFLWIKLFLALNHLLIDDMFMELTDAKLGEGAIGFVFKGYVFLRTQTRFKQKTCAAVKVNTFG